MSHTKYIIYQRFKVKGVVEKHDIIGAIFGQSEGLTGEDLSLKELQSNGKIGRIELSVESNNGSSVGTIEIPSSADMVETAILAATIEAVDKVGPCDAEFVTEKIEDTRTVKRKNIILRAKSLLANLIKDQIPDSQEITREVEEEVRSSEITSYGYDKVPSGPTINESEEIILVEGRADVVNLLKYNIKNVIAFGGSNITRTVVDLCNKKTCLAFIDGDRGGELNLKKLMQMTNVDFVARAPHGKEVEELTKKEILMCLKKKMPIIQTKKEVAGTLDVELSDLDNSPIEEKPVVKPDVAWVDKKVEPAKIEHKMDVKPEVKFDAPKPADFKHPEQKQEFKRPEFRDERREEKKFFSRPLFKPREPQPSRPGQEKKMIDGIDVLDEMSKIKGKLKANFYSQGKFVEGIAVKDLMKGLKEKKNISMIIFDGIVTKRLAEMAKSKGVTEIVGLKVGKMSKIKGINITSLE